jgi:hypothetical protein
MYRTWRAQKGWKKPLFMVNKEQTGSGVDTFDETLIMADQVES